MSLDKIEIHAARLRRLANMLRVHRGQGADAVSVMDLWSDFGDGLPPGADIAAPGPFSAFLGRVGLRTSRRADESGNARSWLMLDEAAEELMRSEAVRAAQHRSEDAPEVPAPAPADWTPVHAPVDPGGAAMQACADLESLRFDGVIPQPDPAPAMFGESLALRPVSLDTPLVLQRLGQGWERVYGWAGRDESVVLAEMREALDRLLLGAAMPGDRSTLLAGGIALAGGE